MNSSIKQQLQSESGQSVILISMVILSFLMFFSFAINTGVLITAKISVQSAADAAAYAGAATQARQLNAISFLNYDMRRQYKKFVYRYAFMGGVASRNFPNDPLVGANPMHYGYPKDYYASANSGRLSVPIKVPVVCIPMTGSATQSDNCVQLNLPNTVAQTQAYFPAGGLTMITQAFLQSASEIQEMQQGQCMKNSGVNLFTLTNWLFRGDIDPSKLNATLSTMTSGLNATDQAKVVSTITNLANGLGLYPRNIINLMRIETLEKFLNEPAKKDLQKDQVVSMEQSASAESNERTIQAFKSALSNLNHEVMNHDTMIMQELQNDHQITINPVQPSFNAYVQYMSATNQSSNGQTICNSKIIPFTAPKVPAGVVKVGNTPIHYAVKITAKAKLLFLPIKEGIELEAFASAKPFGSRIGPANLNESDFVESIKPANDPITSQEINDCGTASVGCNVPNLKISAAETFYSPAYLQTLAQIGVEAMPNGGKAYNFRGLENAMAPQPYEVGHYNIIPPPKSAAEMNYEFIPYAKDQSSKIYRFYAPIFPASSGDPVAKIKDFMAAVFGTTNVSGNNSFGLDMMALKADLESNMIDYVQNKMVAGASASENGETQTFAAIELPMAPETPLQPNPKKYWLTTAEETRSSWGPDFGRVDGTIKFQPRFGYSVKFVAMQNLLQSGMNSSDDDQEKVSH